MEGRQIWPKRSHERSVERFYTRGGNAATDIHRGYLNFGLWDEGVTDYIVAAENLVGRLAALGGIRSGSRVLDVACGMGAQDVYLQRTLGPLEIDAVDLTWRHLERARRRAASEVPGASLRFHHASATALPFPDRRFTHVLSVEGPTHFATRRRFLSEAFRVLEPGGVLVLGDHALRRHPGGPLERLAVEAARVCWRVPHDNVRTPEEYGAHVREAGFTDVRVEQVGERTFPGYLGEQRRPEFRREMDRVQGRLLARLGQVINVAAERGYRMGLLEYVLVCGRKRA